MQPYTVCLTSCGRFDLLERTLVTLLPCLKGPVAKFLIIEDSGDPAVNEVVRRFNGSQIEIQTIINVPCLGQVESIDKVYSHVETEYCFHCEDDWEFIRDDFIEESFVILEEFEKISMVSPRYYKEKSFPHGFFGPEVSWKGISYRVANPPFALGYAGLFFSPGLRRMKEYRIIGPYAPNVTSGGEREVALIYEQLGYRVAILGNPAVRHIGEGRHAPNRAKPAGLGNKFARSMKKRAKRLKWRLCPRLHPVKRALRLQAAASRRR